MIALSELDERRFGHVTAKAEVGPADDVAALLAECGERGVRLLIARCSTEHLAQVQAMERHGFFLADTLVFYRKKRIAPRQLALPEAFTTRMATPADEEAVTTMAARAFRGYAGHYHADPHLDRGRCDAVYASWAGNSCHGGAFCDAMILVESARDRAIAAFATLKRHGASEFEGVLFGVDPAFQGKGLYPQLMDLAQQWGCEQGLQRMVVSTQVTNVTVQKAWCRQRFEPLRSCYTLHKWLP